MFHTHLKTKLALHLLNVILGDTVGVCGSELRAEGGDGVVRIQHPTLKRYPRGVRQVCQTAGMGAGWWGGQAV